MIDQTNQAIASALLATYEDIFIREQQPPSRAIQLGAMTTIGRGQITIRRALTYDVPSSSEAGRVHVVALYLKNKRDWSRDRQPATYTNEWRNEITGARCSCPNRAVLHDPPATGGHAPCKHILAALALARLDGYRLELPR